MATIVGDKLKLTNYSYLLNSNGNGWNEDKFSNLRDKSEKLIDAIDIDWRPFSINNCLGDGTYVSYEIKPGDFLETETLINYVSYAYSMSKGFSLNSSLDNNQFNKRPTLLTNLYFNSSNRTLSYQYWPSVGSVYNLTEIIKTNFRDNPEQFGEIFNDYKNNIAAGAGSHAEGLFTYADGIASHAEGFNTYAAYNFSHAEGVETFAYATYTHVEGYKTLASGMISHAEGSQTTSEGAFSHSEGLLSSSIGMSSHSEGINTIAFGVASHAEGLTNNASGLFSHAEGQNTIAGGLCSHSQGSSTKAIYPYSTAIGLGTYALNSEAEVALGKWNVSKEGYLVTIGNGIDNDNRNNLLEITNNGWTYIGALFSYVNNLTSSKTTINFDANSDNFIRINSFNDLNRTDTNSYNLIFNSYSIPTKNYIDRLLEAKDVLHFAGAVHLNASTSDNSGNISDVEWTHKNSISADYNPEDITYYLSSAYSAGALWKVTNSGYFGNIYCQAGDVLLSYDDSATSNNTNGWLLVGSHIGVIENEGILNRTYPVSNESNQIITNVNLSENGKLSYTFAPLVTTYSSVDNSGFLSNISLVKSNDKITIAYTHTGFVNSKQNGTVYNVSSTDNEFEFISNVNLDNNGKLTYKTSTVTGLKNHHSTENGYNGGSISSNDIVIISGINLNESGKLSYSYFNIELDNHHHSSEGTQGTLGNIDIANGGNNVVITYIANTYLSESGKLSYTYSIYSISNLRNHHGGSIDTGSTGKTLKFGEDFKLIKNATLSSDGTLSGGFTTYTLPSLSTTGSYDNNEKDQFIVGINVNDTGQISYTYSPIPKISTESSLNHNALHNAAGERPTLITNIGFDLSNNKISYEYWPAVGSVYKPNTNFTTNTLKNQYLTNQGNYGEVFNDYSSNVASEKYSHAEGKSTTASAECSHSEGINTIASGVASHAEGLTNNASGLFSHAEGQNTIAGGLCSHSQGSSTKAIYPYSTAIGLGTYALNSEAEVALGKWNVSKPGYLVTIGNGENDTLRHNVVEITNNGYTYIAKLAGVWDYWPPKVEPTEIIKDYLYIENISDEECVVTLTKTGSPNDIILDYSTDNQQTWNTCTNNPTNLSFSIPANGKVYLKGNNSTFSTSSSNYYTFSFDKQCNIGGKLMTLINREVLNNYMFYKLFYQNTNLVSAENLILSDNVANYCYDSMFLGCTALVNAPALPATTLAICCYFIMFKDCTALETAPTLPATTLASSCYNGMFDNCTALVNAPALPATTLVNFCYCNMFRGCTALETAPTLPATTLAGYCYDSMFLGCTALVNAPALPATTLANNCYGSMFYGCTALVNAPVLPAITLFSGCYQSMFYHCSKLKKIKAMFTTEPSSNYTMNWLYSVASSGTFVKNKDATWNVTEIHDIPSGWKIREK